MNSGRGGIPMQKHSYLGSTFYRRWTAERDAALERLHINAQLEATDEMRNSLTQVLLTCKAHYYELKHAQHATTVDNFEQQIKNILRAGGDRLFHIYSTLKVRSYVLARAAETEIVAQLNQRRQIHNRVEFNIHMQKQGEESFAGGPLHQRIQMYMDRLARQIISRAQSSAILAQTEYDFLLDVLMAFPKRKIYRRPPKALKTRQLTEAEKPPKVDASIDNIDENVWRDMVAAYEDEYIPKWRAPEYIVDIPVTDPTITATGEEVWYAWEFERDLTNEFVNAVREGSYEGAISAGITDFVWVAVIDSATDACCRWRDGLLLSEIEKQLDQHKDDDAECDLDDDGLNPPIHFNCRCTLAPATDEIPDKPSADNKDFAEWLES